MTTIHHYERDTGRYLGTGQADPNPEDPEDPIVPAYATMEAPPQSVPAGQAPYWNGTAWDIRPIVRNQGAPVLIDDIDPTPELLLEHWQARMEQEASLHLDGLAQSMGYKNIDAAVSYAEEPAVPKYQEEGRALRQHRSLFWRAFYEELATVGRDDEPPTVTELLARLPSLPSQ